METLHTAAGLDVRSEDTTWTTRRWTTEREVVTAFMAGAMEASLESLRDPVVPRYAETICGQLGNHVRGLWMSNMEEIAPLQVEVLLLNWARNHYAVKDWRLDLGAVCRNAANYLRGKAALEGA